MKVIFKRRKGERNFGRSQGEQFLPPSFAILLIKNLYKYILLLSLLTIIVINISLIFLDKNISLINFMNIQVDVSIVLISYKTKVH